MTTNQFIKSKSKNTTEESNTLAMNGDLFRSGICTGVYVTTPKWPNVGSKQVVVVKLCNGKEEIVYVSGDGYNRQEHSVVIVKGGICEGFTGVRHHLVRGLSDLKCIGNRYNSGSKYGTEMVTSSKNHQRCNIKIPIHQSVVLTTHRSLIQSAKHRQLSSRWLG
ncbi:30S ribosomal protein S12 [Candidatus Hodgkinia cicadicola]|uniref:Small ribosomal subunit protein uS12 n=1 Tax=Candidatus Hodgkinia cicadicola TaxID=573658 RepID=A0ABX4MER8_9HYPH|nr:30S ribosomal protein S12 [Candidatus Hodgkinia cicadicola]